MFTRLQSWGEMMYHIFISLTSHCCTFMRLLWGQSNHLLLSDNKLIIAMRPDWPRDRLRLTHNWRADKHISLTCSSTHWINVVYFHALQHQTCVFSWLNIYYMFSIVLVSGSVLRDAAQALKQEQREGVDPGSTPQRPCGDGQTSGQRLCSWIIRKCLI